MTRLLICIIYSCVIKSGLVDLEYIRAFTRHYFYKAMRKRRQIMHRKTRDLIDEEQKHLTEDTDANTREEERTEEAEEETVEDTDADTRDEEERTEEAEEETVEDTDADTRDVMSVLSELSGRITSLERMVIETKDLATAFVDGGAVVREEYNDGNNYDDNDDTDFVPIEELDLTL